VSAQKQKQSKEEIQAETQRLEQKNRENQAKQAEATQTSRPSGQELNSTIERYEKMLEQCAGKKSDRCADVMYTLGSLYYDQGKDDYARAVERFADESKAYERTGRGAQPRQPVPDYSKSLKMYGQLTREYPAFLKLDGALFQMSTIYFVSGKLDSAVIVLEQLVQRFPKSPRISEAKNRLALPEVEALRRAAAQQGEERLARVREEFKKNPIGYDPFVWETSIEIVKAVYPNAIEKDEGDNIKTLKREKTGENEPDRIYYFYRKKLFKVEVSYSRISGDVAELLIEKIASNYGTFKKSKGTDFFGASKDKYLWTYHKNLNVELEYTASWQGVVVYYFDPVFIEYIKIDKEKKENEANKKKADDLGL
jgi:tetratricopeptide (TPR) repeat protein